MQAAQVSPSQASPAVEVSLENEMHTRQEFDAKMPSNLTTDKVGGLLNEGGEDVRTTIDADGRRKNLWRGQELADNAGVQYDFALNIIDSKIQMTVMTSDLRAYAVFLTMFVFFFLVGRDTNATFYLSEQVLDEIGRSEFASLKSLKTYQSIIGPQDWIEYVHTNLVGTLHDNTMGYIVKLGALRFRTQRVTSDSCVVNNYVIPTNMPPQTRECYGPITPVTEDKGLDDKFSKFNRIKRWKWKACHEMKGGSMTSGHFAFYHCGGFVFDVPFYSGPSLQHRFEVNVTENLYVFPALKEPAFVDAAATRFVIVEWFMYHPALDKFVSVKLFTEASPGGMWKPSYQFRIFEVWTEGDVPKTVYDFFFFIGVLYYVFKFFHELLRFKRRYGKTMAFFFDIWNFLEFINLLFFLVTFTFRWIWWDKCRKANLQLNHLAFPPEYPGVLEDIQWYYSQQVYLNSVNTILTFLKVLKFLRLNNRLNILSRTLAECQDSIIGVLFIFFLIVTAFAMTGHGLFGMGVWDFRSIDASYATLMRMLFGDFDYDALKRDNRILASLFFWAFLILGLFCLLNFLIGVLTEAFSNVSKTRTILPLEEVVVKSWGQIRKGLSWDNIKRSISRRIKGHTKENLLLSLLQSVEAYRERLYPPDAVDVTEAKEQMIFKCHVYDAMEPEVRELLSDALIEFLWDDVVYEWDQSHQADAAINARQNVEATMEGIQIHIGPQLTKLFAFAKRLNDIESKLQKMNQML